jgi:hypothetical protein
MGQWRSSCGPLVFAPPDPDQAATGVTLEPRYWVSIGVIALALALWLLRPLVGPASWSAPLLALFGLFLAVQTRQLRLQFGDDELLVRRNSTVIRRFPYAGWLGWRLFWPGLPVLLYFREERSIHLLPVLFDAAALRLQLEQHLGDRGASSKL